MSPSGLRHRVLIPAFSKVRILLPLLKDIDLWGMALISERKFTQSGNSNTSALVRASRPMQAEALSSSSRGIQARSCGGKDCVEGNSVGTVVG